MSLRVLGCSGAIAAGSRTTAFLLGRHILVDAGTGVGDLTLEEMVDIDHILLSHSHLDHILGVPLLADSTLRLRQAQGRGPITIHALPATLQALNQHVLNDVIWPDFTRLPTSEAPALRLAPVEVGDELELDAYCLRVLPAAHTVPACGFAMRRLLDAGWIVYTGDTGPNPALWATLRDDDVRQVIIEVAFSDEERHLAQLACHHAPGSLVAELEWATRTLKAPPFFWLTHIKPGEAGRIADQIGSRWPAHRWSALATGQMLTWSGQY